MPQQKLKEERPEQHPKDQRVMDDPREGQFPWSKEAGDQMAQGREMNEG